MFLDPRLLEDVPESLRSQVGIYEFNEPPYKRHKCRLLRRARLPQKEIDYMVGKIANPRAK